MTEISKYIMDQIELKYNQLATGIFHGGITATSQKQREAAKWALREIAFPIITQRDLQITDLKRKLYESEKLVKRLLAGELAGEENADLLNSMAATIAGKNKTILRLHKTIDTLCAVAREEMQ